MSIEDVRVDHVDRLRADAHKARPTGSYAGRVAETVRDHLDEILAVERAIGAAYAEGRIEQLERQVALVEERADRYRDMHTSATERADTYKRMLDDRHAITRAEVADGEDRVKVQLGKAHGDWSLADIEELAYRLRLAGATDETVVDGIRSTVSAACPAPNLISLHAIGSRPSPPERHAPLPDPTAPEVRLRIPRIKGAGLLLVGLVIVLSSIVLGLVIL